jgi:hypothetical protein
MIPLERSMRHIESSKEKRRGALSLSLSLSPSLLVSFLSNAQV